MLDYTALLTCGVALLTGVFGYFFKRLVGSLDGLQRAFDEESRRLWTEVNKIRGDYVRSDAFFRFQSSIDQKLNQIYELLVERK